jgi:predicted GH43/DUF377 family glycosyl hydrolase
MHKAVIGFKKLFSDTSLARYNAAAWLNPEDDNIFLVFREVHKAAKTGEPDFGRLVLVEIDERTRNVLHEKVVWEARGGIWLEDPRALVLQDNSVIIGMTALVRESKGYVPYPAVTRLKTRVWREVLPAITLVETFGSGKNMTPIDNFTYMFRPDTYSHKLLVFSFTDLMAKKIQDLEFPEDLPWAKYKIGTAMPPVWLTPKKALMIFHGITIENGRYVYSLGKALLREVRGKFKIKVDREPLVKWDDFTSPKGKRLVKELHPKIRKVVYACGGYVDKRNDKLYLYVNVGDTATYEVEMKFSKLNVFS